jgi:hypothetical protein
VNKNHETKRVDHWRCIKFVCECLWGSGHTDCQSGRYSTYRRSRSIHNGAQTQAAIPSATQLPPTEAPTQTPLPSLTPITSPTLDGQNSTPIGLTVTPQTNIPTFTPQASGSGTDPCNQALTAWQGPSANLNIVNETRPRGTIILSLYVVTELGQCGYLYVTGESITGPVGQYSAGAFVEGPKNLKVFGGFRITEGSWDIVVRNDNIVALGGCYPSC